MNKLIVSVSVAIVIAATIGGVAMTKSKINVLDNKVPRSASVNEKAVDKPSNVEQVVADDTSVVTASVTEVESTATPEVIPDPPRKLSNNEMIVMAQSLGMFQLPTYAYTEWPEKFYSDNALDSMTKIKQMCERLNTPTCMTSFITTRAILRHEGKMDLSSSDKWDFVINYSY